MKHFNFPRDNPSSWSQLELKSVNKASTSCVRTACPKLSTCLEQLFDNLEQARQEDQTCCKVVLTTLIQTSCNKLRLS